MRSHNTQRRVLRRVAAALALCFAWWATAGTTALAAGGRTDKNEKGLTRKLTAVEMQAFSGSQMPPPPPPTNLAATGGGYLINLTWTSGAVNFNVKRSTTVGGPYTQIGTSTTTSYSDQTCAPYTRYYYVVTAQGMQESQPSNEANAYATIGQRAGLPEPWQIGRANGPYAQVNMTDGNQTFAIPIVSYAGRGLPTSFSLAQNSTDSGLRACMKSGGNGY